MQTLFHLLKHIPYLILLLSSLDTYAQDSTYFRVNEHIESRNSRQIIKNGDRFFVINTGICNNFFECSSVMEMDLEGNILWEAERRWLDVALNSMVIYEDTISVAGNTPQDDGFYLHQMSVEGGDSISTYRIEDPADPYERMFHLAHLRHNGKHLIGGRGIKNDSMYALIYVVNPGGSLDTLISPIHNDLTAIIWDMYIDSEGLLNVFLELDTKEGDDYRMIVKYDDQFNKVWSYTSEELRFNFNSKPRGCELQDGRIAFVYGIDDIYTYMYSIRTINPDSTLSWWYQWPNIGGNNAREIYRLKTLANGDIIGVGDFTTPGQVPRVSRTPFIFRLSAEGELLWKRVFLEVNPVYPDESINGTLFDVYELDNGSLWAVGGWETEGYGPNDPLVILMDAEGCLIPDCDEFVPTATKKMPAFDGKINVFPNPIGNDLLMINIQPADGAFNVYQLKIYDFQGKLLQTRRINTGNNELDFSKYHKGIYLIVIEEDGVVIGRERVVR